MEQRPALETNGFFLKLLPALVEETAAQQAFEESVAKTVRPTPAAQQRASRWLERNLSFGKRWANGFVTAEKIKVGGYCFVPGVIDEPRIVLGAPGATVSVWDFSREIGFTEIALLLFFLLEVCDGVKKPFTTE